MENMTSAQLAQLLYVAYYGRPADQSGLDFWTDRIDEVGVQGIAADFGASAEFDARFGDSGSLTLINNLYQQLFGRDAETEGLQYWQNVLSNGTPLAQIAYEIANGAQGGDMTGLMNKVTLANQFTAAVAAGGIAYEGEAAANYGRDFLASINENTNVDSYDIQAVVNGIESGNLPVDTADLRAALQDLREAEESLSDFLQGALDNEDVVDALATGVTVESATDVEIIAAITAAEDAASADLQDNFGLTGFTAAGANTKTGLINDGLAAREETLENAQQAVTDAYAVIDTIPGLRAAVDAYYAAVEASAEADEALVEATAVADGAAVTFAGRSANYSVSDITYQDAADLDTTDRAAAEQVSINTTPVLELVDGQYVVVDGIDAASYPGLATFQAALQAEKEAFVAADEAATAETQAETDLDNELGAANLTQAQIDALDAELGSNASDTAASLTFVLDGREGDVETAEEALAAYNEAVADWQATAEIEAQYTELADAVTAAEEFITDSEEDGGLGFNLITGLGAATDANDVYLFEDNAGTTTDVANFGDSGIDRIYFGPDYQLVELAEGETTAANRVGSSSALEIFWSQDGDNLQLFIEEVATSGNATSDDEITQITLTGVNGDDVSFTSGFLAAGTAEIA
ncbi:DUF4214 domain-containing protein [Halomonas sp. HMF6819]|uniref:DUF4214 domain-containing protein n=1 Tax=Halomonas sp. HMF6819 TaxID=3373085 RepID=UPI0037A34A14